MSKRKIIVSKTPPADTSVYWWKLTDTEDSLYRYEGSTWVLINPKNSNDMSALYDMPIVPASISFSNTTITGDNKRDAFYTAGTTSTSSLIIAEKGTKVRTTVTSSYNKDSAHKAPTKLTFLGENKSSIKGYSKTIENIITDTNYTVTHEAPAQGALVSGNKIVKAPQGSKDTSSATVRVLFKDRIMVGKTTDPEFNTQHPNTDLVSNKLSSTRNLTVENVTTTDDEYLYFMYPIEMGELKSITFNGTSPVLGDFIKKSAKYVRFEDQEIYCHMYISKNKGAFKGDTLTFS